MSSVKLCCFVGILLQILVNTNAKPLGFGCGEPVQPCGGGSQFGGFEGFGGGFGGFGGGFGGFGGGCGPAIAPSPPISFLPVPQPLPIRVPVPPRQSVTIPNIILALLPPNNKPPCAPKPIIRPPPPAPVILPLPQPFPFPVPSECGDEGFGGFGGFGGSGGFRGIGGGGCGC